MKDLAERCNNIFTSFWEKNREKRTESPARDTKSAIRQARNGERPAETARAENKAKQIANDLYKAGMTQRGREKQKQTKR